MPPSRIFARVIFAFWVSICAAAPEVIWQGFYLLYGHFSASQVYSVLLIGMLLAFFVEPLMERIKAGRWDLEHQHTRDLIYTAIVSLVFAAAAVSVHEALNAYLSGEHSGDHDRQATLVKAMKQVREWASIPFVVTLAWFGARQRGWIAAPVGILVCAWVAAFGLTHGWQWSVVVTTAMPCCVIAVLGCITVSRSWGTGTFSALARLTAAIAACWLVLAWLVQGCAWLLGAPDFRLYTGAGFFEDFRFYLGWSLGLAVAPNPVREEARQADPA